ncbi:MAG: efflux RND transporter periplasmic adaptor subunit, partial [Verrucomicrobia bacterium]|nr:efflux RND transporter periplasmic adaptor subunit [Verrucomicrobiota bacterium]
GAKRVKMSGGSLPKGEGQGEGERGARLRRCSFGRSWLKTTYEVRTFASVLVLAALMAGCGKRQEGVKQAPPTVTVSQPLQQEVTDYLELTGTVTPSRSVDLVARVTGYLQSVDFQDGAMVPEGKLLFVIEPDPYKQQLLLAKAAHERAKAEHERQVSLIASNATSLANVEKWRSERDQAAAQVELAKLNLGYTEVKAPFSGRIGRRLVDEGNLVGPGVNTKLATMDQLEPIYAYFNLNERDTLKAVTIMRLQGLDPRRNIGKTPVFLGLQNQDGYPEEGTLDFADTGISTSSGTMQLRALFSNTNHLLIAGAFARVRIPLGGPKPMLIVPASVIGNDQEGDYALVVGAGDVVARRGVVKGPLTTNGRALRSGLTAQDRVIVNGMMRAKPGDKVTPVTGAAGQSAPSAAGH